MTVYHVSDIRKWTEKQKKNLEFIAADAIQEVSRLATRRQPGVGDTGGSYQEGLVPVDTGELINSYQLSVDGGVVGTGETSHVALMAGFELGSVVQGAFTAPHARPMEYGVTGRFGGRFFVRNAVQQWSSIVRSSAEKFR